MALEPSDSSNLEQLASKGLSQKPGKAHTTWMKTTQGDLSSLDPELCEAIELAQNRPIRGLVSLYSATHS